MFQFNLFEKIFDLLEKYKERLGPLHGPLSKLLAAVLFVAFVGIILWLPMSYVGSFKLIAPIQITVLLVYFTVLSGEQAIERFAFILTALVVVVGGIPAIMLEHNLGTIEGLNPETFPGLVMPRIEIFFFGLLIGIGFAAWVLPLFLFLFPVWATLSKSSPRKLDRLIGWTLLLGLVFHLISFAFMFWQGQFGLRSGSDLDWLPGAFAGAIHDAQLAYRISFLAAFASGLVTLLCLFLLKRRLKNLGFFALAAIGVAISLASFAASRASLFELNTCFPAANGRVEAYLDRQNELIVYKFPLFDDLGAEALEGLVALAECRNPEAGEFTLRAEHRAKLSEVLPSGEGRFVKHNIAQLLDAEDPRLICGQIPGG